MKNLLLPFVAASLLVALPGQDAATKALQRAQLLEQQEGDLAAAQQAYRALLADAAASAVHGEAALRLGTLLWRLEQRDTATPLLQQAKAAGGDVATRANAVLQGQDAESKQQAELLAKAQALAARVHELVPTSGMISEVEATRLRQVVDELRQLGPIATRSAIQEVERLRQSFPRQDLRMAKTVETLLALLWEVGGSPAIDALARWSKDPDVLWRRQVTSAIESPRPIASDLLPTLMVYLADEDPVGDVARNLSSVVLRLPHEEHVRLAKSPTPALQRAGLQALAKQWHSVPPLRQRATVDELAELLVRTTHAPNPMLARAAWDLLFEFAYRGPANGQILLCGEIQRMPSFEPNMQASHNREGQDDVWIGAIALAAARLGPLPERTEGDGRTLLAHMLTGHRPLWTRSGAEAALQLVELGYAGGIGIPAEDNLINDWVVHLARVLDTDRTDRLIATIGQINDPSQLLKQLQQRPVPRAVFEAIRGLLARSGQPDGPAWLKVRTPVQRDVAGTSQRVLAPGGGVFYLLQFAVDSGHPEVAPWLWQQLERDPGLASGVASGLRTLSWRGDVAARVELRKLLVWPGNDQNELQPAERSQVLAELVRSGDEPTIELLPRAHALGLETTLPFYEPLGAEVPAARTPKAAGIGFLMMALPAGDPSAPAWHGYDDANLLRAWRMLLTSSEAAAWAWSELAGGAAPGGQPPRANPRSAPPAGQPVVGDVPPAVVPLVLELLPPWWAARLHDEPRLAKSILEVLGKSMARLPADSFATETPMHQAIQNALRSSVRDYAEQVFLAIPQVARGHFANEARALLETTENTWLLYQVLRDGLRLPEATWRLLLQHRSAKMRVAALGAIPATEGHVLRETVLAQLRAELAEVRLAAAVTTASLFGPEAVPALLPLLQDQEGDVRKAVREQLERLRQDTEQRAFWQQAQAGIDTSSQGASTKLLLQARAGQPKEQRLLALRSLATLGVAATLPYLIDATNDADPEIAAAARSAIATIHQTGGAPAERASTDGK